MSRFRTLLVVFFLGLLIPLLALAKAPKKYQVTGKLLEVTDELLVVDKAGEKFEIARDKDTKVEGELKVGEKITVYYTMTAASVEVKQEKKK